MEFYQTNIEGPVHLSTGDVVRVQYREKETNQLVQCTSTVTKTTTPDGWEGVKSFYIMHDIGGEERRVRCRVASGIGMSVAAQNPDTGIKKDIGQLTEVKRLKREGDGMVRVDDEMVRSAANQ